MLQRVVSLRRRILQEGGLWRGHYEEGYLLRCSNLIRKDTRPLRYTTIGSVDEQCSSVFTVRNSNFVNKGTGVVLLQHPHNLLLLHSCCFFFYFWITIVLLSFSFLVLFLSLFRERARLHLACSEAIVCNWGYKAHIVCVMLRWSLPYLGETQR